MKTEKKTENKKEQCEDRQCPLHGQLSARGRKFEGYVIKKFPRRVVIEFSRVVKIQKYERYLNTKTKIHARLPDCMASLINVGDYIEVQECRPLSKIIHHVVIAKIRDFRDAQKSEGNKISDSKKIHDKDMKSEEGK